MKKTKFILSSLLGVLFLISFQSCIDHFDDLNTNPTLVSGDVVDPAMLFAQAVRGGTYSIPFGPGAGSVAEYSGNRANPASGNIFNHSQHENPFQNMMTNEVIAISEMIRQTENSEFHANTNAKGRIWRVWLFQQITDAYGDIPYFEAALSQDESVNTPAYDSQRDIYIDFMAQLEQAAADLQDSADRVSLGSSDLIYEGDIEMWRRFANSLRLRYALRVRFADPDLAQNQVDDVLNEPLIEDNSQNAQVIPLSSDTPHTSNRHPFYNYMHGSPLNPLICTHTMIWNMTSTGSDHLDLNDPRLPIYCSPAEADGAWRGRQINREDDAGWFYATSRMSLVSPNTWDISAQPIVVLDYAETQFNIAEARLAGLANGDPQEGFENGIRASLEFHNVDEGEITDFLNSSAGTLSGDDENRLRMISTQRWVSKFPQTMEQWTEYRRTGYPYMYTYRTQKGHTGGQIPRRLPYPSSEYDVNGTQLQAAIDRLGGDELMSRMWWDARPDLPFLHPDHGIFPPPPDQDVESWPTQ